MLPKKEGNVPRNIFELSSQNISYSFHFISVCMCDLGNQLEICSLISYVLFTAPKVD